MDMLIFMLHPELLKRGSIARILAGGDRVIMVDGVRTGNSDAGSVQHEAPPFVS
jgi:hypothetical protein